MKETFKYIKVLLLQKSKTTELTNEEKAILDEISKHDGYFPITSLHRDDLKHLGFEVRTVDDDKMKRLSEKLSDDYCEQLYWDSLRIIAEFEGIKYVTPPEFEFIKKDAVVEYNGKPATIIEAPEYSIDFYSDITIVQNGEELYVYAEDLKKL